MGINVRVQKSPKPLDVIEVQAKLERDLRSCMRCRFFYGNNRQCIAKKCVKEDAQPKAVEQFSFRHSARQQNNMNVNASGVLLSWKRSFLIII